MKITLEGGLEEIELLARALRMAQRNGELGMGNGELKGAAQAEGPEIFRVLDMSRPAERRVIDISAQSLEQAVSRAVNYEDEHAGEGVRVIVIQREEDKTWRQVWPAGPEE